MSKGELHFHYVSTREKAREMAAKHDRFWVSNCGCREAGEGCKRSRTDICSYFRKEAASDSTGLKEISRAEMEEIFKEAGEKHLVTRPFRNGSDFSITDGVCFCCDDCCGYFKNPENVICDRGDLMEKTDMEACTHCADCAAVCYFHARKMVEGLLVVAHKNCYGCGLCLEVCPVNCIEMVKRK